MNCPNCGSEMKTCCQIYQERLEEARRNNAYLTYGHSCGQPEWICQNCGFRRVANLPHFQEFNVTIFPLQVFPASSSVPNEILGESLGPDVEASHIIAEWKKGKSSTEIATLFKLPENYVTRIIHQEILEHPTHKTIEKSEPQTITRLKALKREIPQKGRK